MVSTVLFSLGDVQFSGHESWIWYSHVPLLALQNPMFGRTLVGNSEIMGANVQLPIEPMMTATFWDIFSIPAPVASFVSTVRGRLRVLCS